MQQIIESILKDGDYISITDKETSAITQGVYRGVLGNALVLGASIQGNEKQIAETMKIAAGSFNGHVPKKTYIAIDTIKRITTFEKYEEEKEGNDKS